MVRKLIIRTLPFLLLPLALGCTRKSETATIRFTAPQFSAQKITFAKSVGTMTENGGGFNSLLNPLTMAEFNCYGVFVGGEKFNNGGTCSVTDGTSFSFGDWAGGVAAGGSLELVVPSGVRTIMLMGFKAETAAHCSNFKNGMPMMNLSEPFVVAKTTADVPAGPYTLSLKPESMTAKINNCQFASNSGGDNQYFFGTGSDGDINAASTLYLTNTTNASSQYLMSLSRVTTIANNGNGTADITVTASWNSAAKSHVKEGDEIMLYAAAGSPGSPGGCNEVYQGFSMSGIVTSATTGGAPGRTFKMMIRDQRWLSIPAANVTAAASGSFAPTNFCRIIAVRVPHLNNVSNAAAANLTIGVASVGSLDLTQSDHTNLGLLPVRIKGTLTVTPSYTLTFNADGVGFKGGDNSNLRGHGEYGHITGNSGTPFSSLGMAGGYQSVAACGGGHGGLGGCNFSAAGSGAEAGDQYGCSVYDANKRCLRGKFFLGGGGGADLSSGGVGGGALRIYAKNVALGGTLNLFANGGNGASTDDAGGAGGSIFFVADVFSGAGGFNFNALGGNGSGGGVGGGGRVHMIVKDSTGFTGGSNITVDKGSTGDLTNATNGTAKAEGITVVGAPP